MPTVTTVFELNDSDFAGLNQYLTEKKWSMNDYVKTLIEEHQMVLLESKQKSALGMYFGTL